MVIILTLKTIIKNHKEIRKIFGKKEIKIILKQLEGISLNQSEKNRLSRDIRPKLNIIKELSQFKDEFELKKDQENKKIIDKAVSIILNDKLKKDIKAILLFGSHSKGIVTPKSDIDICIVFEKIENPGKFRLSIMSNLPEKVDIQVFNILPQKIKRDIARNHKILYKKKEFDNIDFTIKYLKDDDYFIRMKRIMGEAA